MLFQHSKVIVLSYFENNALEKQFVPEQWRFICRMA